MRAASRPRARRAARLERHFVVGAQVDDTAEAQRGERRAPVTGEAGEVSGAEEDAAPRDARRRREAAHVAEVQRAAHRQTRGGHDVALGARSPRRGGTGYFPAIVMRLKAPIETSSQLRATYSSSVKMLQTWSYSSSETPSSWM